MFPKIYFIRINSDKKGKKTEKQTKPEAGHRYKYLFLILKMFARKCKVYLYELLRNNIYFKAAAKRFSYRILHFLFKIIFCKKILLQ